MNSKTLLVPALLIFGAIVIIILGITLFFSDSGKKPDYADSPSGLIIGNNAIYAADQMPGYRVSVQVVYLKKPGFVVIYEDSNGAPGKVLGQSSLLAAGETKNLPPIALSRATKDGETIYAMLYFDNKDGKFDAINDKPPLDRVEGKPVMMIVAVSKDAIEPEPVNP